MNVMSEPNSTSLRNNVRFAVNSHLSCPDRSGCKERKQRMTSDHELATPHDSAIVFVDYQPQMKFSVANTDRATLLQLAAQQYERKRIAQELHDTLLQGFTSVALKLEVLSHSLPPGLSKPKEQLGKLLEQIDEHLAEARRSIWKLRSTTREGGGTFP